MVRIGDLRPLLLRLLFLLTTSLFASGALADEQVTKAAVANWVDLIEVPKAQPGRETQVRDGLYNLLYDNQARRRDGGAISFRRVVYKITDRPGLEQGARIDIEFDPARSKVAFNRLQIIRDGVVIDRLPDANFEVFRRETDSERGIFDGRLTLHVDIDDVRVGDIVDYATTYDTSFLVGDDLMFVRFTTEWDEPIGLIRQKFIWPALHPLQILPVKTRALPAITTTGTETTYLWEISDPNPIKVQDNLPAGYSSRGFVEVSSARDWQHVVDAVRTYYKATEDFPTGFALKLDAIAARHAAPEDRLVEALRLVQDEIRYVSLSIGTGSYVPRSPQTVVASGFGDCKDKALLLASALQRLGIYAEVALTDIDEGKGLDRVLPALQAFDHAIVKARIGERTYWLDATDYLQGGRADGLVPPDFGFALPIVPSGAALEKIEQKLQTAPTISIAERFEMPKADGDPLLLIVTTDYRDDDADATRRRFARESISKIAEGYLEYYSRLYPGIGSTAMLEAKDDRDANVFRTTEAYALSSASLHADNLAANFPLKADLGTPSLPTPTMVGRTEPVSLGRLVYKTHKVTVANLKAQFIGPEDSDVMTLYVGLKILSRSSPTEFEIAWHFKTFAEQVPASAIADYLKAVQDINRNVEWIYNFTLEDEPAAPQDDAPPYALVAGGVVLLSILAFVGAIIYEAAAPQIPEGQLYWPISIQKFLVMSVLTFNLYVYLWAWRSLRQSKKSEGTRNWPLWRAFFFPIWLYPTFASVNHRLSVPDRVPQWLGVVGAIALIATWFLGIPGYEAIDPEKNLLGYLALYLFLPCLAPLPLVVAMNRLNVAAPEHVLRNSRYTTWDFLVIAVGLPLWGSTIYLIS